MITLTPDIPSTARYWRNDPKISAWCRQNHLISEAQQKEWLHKIETDPSIKMFGVVVDNGYRTGDNTLVGEIFTAGVAGLTSISMVHRHAEFSLYIAPEHQGAGYGKPALIELLKYGFWNLGLNRIWGEVFAGNQALTSFLEVGFTGEGLCRQSYFKNGRFIDSHIISILRSEFDAAYRTNND